MIFLNPIYGNPEVTNMKVLSMYSGLDKKKTLNQTTKSSKNSKMWTEKYLYKNDLTKLDLFLKQESLSIWRADLPITDFGSQHNPPKPMGMCCMHPNAFNVSI
ncbi:unnamed protein product [Owenia fusiformis]|uniref:Uncharacterized protein n=1 Tax=Owenia fusiformis TaxID=6347 RepID=A0A8S4Q977_OWEFU|nr:unnamed protein product [Owenia fusiformis]